MPRVECGYSLGRRIHIGGLGVVVELDAVDRGNKLKPMLDRLEALDGLANRVRRRSGEPGRAPLRPAHSPHCARL